MKKHTNRGGSNSGATTEGFETSIYNLTSCIIHLYLQLHHITTGRCTDKPSTHRRIILVKRANVARIVEVINHLLVIKARQDLNSLGDQSLGCQLPQHL